MDTLDDLGLVSKLSAIFFFFKVNYSFKERQITSVEQLKMQCYFSIVYILLYNLLTM